MMNRRMRMKKWWLTMLCALVCMVFAGCGEVQIDVGIDEAYNAFLRYHITGDVSSMSKSDAKAIESAVSGLADYYESTLDFEVQRAFPGGGFDITMELKKPCGSYEEAFAALKETLSEETITPFLHVNMEMAAEEYEQAFLFNANTDIAQIIASAHMENLPPDLSRRIETALEGITGEISVTLPASVVTSGEAKPKEGAGLLYTASVPLALDGPTEITLDTRLSIEDGAAVSRPIGDTIALLKSDASTFTIIMVVCAALGLLAIVLVVVLLMKRQKAAMNGHAEERDI